MTAIENDMGSLVSTEWLSPHLNDPDLVTLDCTVVFERKAGGDFRSMTGRSAYKDGHLLTAGLADLLIDLADNDQPIKFRATEGRRSSRSGRFFDSAKSIGLIATAAALGGVFPGWARGADRAVRRGTAGTISLSTTHVESRMSELRPSRDTPINYEKRYAERQTTERINKPV